MRELNSSFDYISKDYKGYKQAMIERLKVLMPEYTDLSETDAGIVILELASVGLDILSAYLDSQANESLLVSAELWSSVLKWAKMLSYEPRFASASQIKQIFVLKELSPTDTLIPAGTKIMTSNVTNETPVYFETINDLVIPALHTGEETDEYGNYLLAVEAQQGVSILGETIGISNGAKDQEFRLGYSPVLYGTIEIWCEDVKWTKAENNSFVNSEPHSKHFTVTMNDKNEAVITFGDNVFGAIPTKDKPVIAYYRVGGGTEGNVAENTVTMLVESDARIDRTYNIGAPTVYGQDTESLKSIKLSAPAISRTTWGAITLQDFTDILIANFPEIKLAKTIRGDTASNEGLLDDTTADDVVIGYVQNKEGEEFTDVSDELAERIYAAFFSRKLAGMENVVLYAVTEVPITEVYFDVGLHNEYVSDLTNISKRIKEAFTHYFDLGNVQIDQAISISDVENYIKANVVGIDYLHLNGMTYYGGTIIDVQEILEYGNIDAFKLLTAENDVNLLCQVYCYNNTTSVQV